ncbi:hypothetical protein D5F01_LYC04617 [Larimichthys crocea]|uniref:Uncharacterized protein n=1 Tax=Larimichthys crocea TaxID=215358 RepID=A0A6G0IX77_LARCR|nr:hypothetical protein D5F01_LYC04617 [Larimichthys crocea]
MNPPLQLFTCSCSPAAVHQQLFTCSCSSAAAVHLQLFISSSCSPAAVHQQQLFTCSCSPAAVHLQQLFASSCSPAAVRQQLFISSCSPAAAVHLQQLFTCSCSPAAAVHLQLFTSSCSPAAVHLINGNHDPGSNFAAAESQPAACSPSPGSARLGVRGMQRCIIPQPRGLSPTCSRTDPQNQTRVVRVRVYSPSSSATGTKKKRHAEFTTDAMLTRTRPELSASTRNPELVLRGNKPQPHGPGARCSVLDKVCLPPVFAVQLRTPV